MQSTPGKRPLDAHVSLVIIYCSDTWYALYCTVPECHDQTPRPGAHYKFHHPTGKEALGCERGLMINMYTYVCITQERYFASLMPLKKDVSPWRVSMQSHLHTLHTMFEPHCGSITCMYETCTRNVYVCMSSSSALAWDAHSSHTLLVLCNLMHMHLYTSCLHLLPVYPSSCLQSICSHLLS